MSHRTAITLGLFLAAAAFAQTVEPRWLHVAVYTPNNKLVVGLEQNNFAVVEGSAVRRVATVDYISPVTIAVVGIGEDTYQQLARTQLVLRANSVPEALNQLAAADGRKALIVPSGTDTEGVPAAIHVVTAQGDFQRAILVARNSYQVRYLPKDDRAPLQVVLSEVDGLPALRVEWQ